MRAHFSFRSSMVLPSVWCSRRTSSPQHLERELPLFTPLDVGRPYAQKNRFLYDFVYEEDELVAPSFSRKLEGEASSIFRRRTEDVVALKTYPFYLFHNKKLLVVDLLASFFFRNGRSSPPYHPAHQSRSARDRPKKSFLRALRSMQRE